MKKKTTLTTGEMADLCGVNIRTVIRWIEKGKIKSFKLPGRGDNRIPIQNVLEFMIKNDLPVPEEYLYPLNRVLIVDDDFLLAKTIEGLLKIAGFETRIANNGFMAGTLINTFRPDLITLDLAMPGIRGDEVIRFIRGNESLKYLKILVVSGMDQKQLSNALRKGADDILKKPFLIEELIDKIEKLLNSRRLYKKN